MSGWFTGFATEIGDDLARQHEEVMRGQIESKRNLLENYKVLLTDPHMQDVHGNIMQAMLKVSATDPAKLHKMVQKPGGEFDPTQWQVMAQQRAAGMMPSPVNQGQNGSVIPAPPLGQMPGQAQATPSWNESVGAQGSAGAPGAAEEGALGLSVPPPPGVQPSPANAGFAQQAGNMTAQSVSALPPTPGNAAPNGAEVASPQQAAAIAPAIAPPPPMYQGGGSLTQQELDRRGLNNKQTMYQMEQQALQNRMNAERKFQTEQKDQERQNTVNTLKAQGVWDSMSPRERAAALTGISSLATQMPIVAKIEPDENSWTKYSTVWYQGGTEVNRSLGATPPPSKVLWAADPKDSSREVAYTVGRDGKKELTGEFRYKTGMMPTQRSSQTTIDSEGNQRTTSTSSKIPPPPAGAPANQKPAQSSGNASGSAGGNGEGGEPKRIRIFNPKGDRIDNIVRLMGQDMQSAEKLIASRQDRVAVGKRMAELGIDPNNITTSMRDRAAQARTVIPHIDEIMRIINEADKAGEIGLVVSRWDDFLTNKLGEDPTKSKVFSKLSSNLSFLQTAVAMAHGGVRAGSSEPIIEHWERTLQAKDAATMKQKLNTARNWMQNYANLVPQGNHEIAPPPNESGNVLQDLINKYK